MSVYINNVFDIDLKKYFKYNISFLTIY